jgi:hypothetical protein
MRRPEIARHFALIVLAALGLRGCSALAGGGFELQPVTDATDRDVGQIDLNPQDTTIAALIALPRLVFPICAMTCATRQSTQRRIGSLQGSTGHPFRGGWGLPSDPRRRGGADRFDRFGESRQYRQRPNFHLSPIIWWVTVGSAQRDTMRFAKLN